MSLEVKIKEGWEEKRDEKIENRIWAIYCKINKAENTYVPLK